MFEFFEIAPKKDAQGDAVYILTTLKLFLKRMKHKRLLKIHPPNVRRGRFFFSSIFCGRLSFLQAVKHFCNFIPLYFMKRFAFLIDDTSLG